MFRSVRRWFAVAVAPLVVLAAPVQAQVGFWSFDDLPTGTLTPFSQTKATITATFSTLNGNVLLSTNAASSRLGIRFDRVIDSLDLSFALNTQMPANPLLLQTFLGSTLVGSTASFGMLQPSGFIEGMVVTKGTLFDRVELSGLAPDLAIDRLNARVSTVPEPATGLLIAAGVLALAARRRAVHRTRTD
jgi:hypothetical protein